jgi:hypothetical protein
MLESADWLTLTFSTISDYFNPLGMENNDIPDSNIVAELDRNKKKFRLNSPYMPAYKATSRMAYGSDHFVTINMGYIPFMVTGIAMQGANLYEHFMIGYVLSLSRDGGEWFDYIEDGEPKVR